MPTYNPNAGESVPTNVERTGDKKFTVKHSDGSIFEGEVDTRDRFNAFKNLKGFGRTTSIGGFGNKKPLICSRCKKEVHKILVKNKICLCDNCI